MKLKVIGDTKGITVPKKSPQDKILISAIDTYLKSKEVGVDRGHGWNSPSSIGGCPRKNFFQRTKVVPDYTYNEPRLQRIFDNGTFTHIRLQEYLLKSGVLLDDEAPLFNLQYKIMGTTDGLLLTDEKEGRISVLEIKSINSYGFSSLKDAKPEHKLQANLYLFCLNELRKELLRGNRDKLEKLYLDELNSYLKDGKEFTKEQKVKKRFNEFTITLNILEKYPKPIKQVIFLYENKDSQELKEFVVEDDGSLVKEALEKISFVNHCVETGEIPQVSKSFMCNGCSYRERCKLID